MKVSKAGLASKVGQVSQPVRTKQAGAGGPVKADRAVTVNIKNYRRGFPWSGGKVLSWRPGGPRFESCLFFIFSVKIAEARMIDQKRKSIVDRKRKMTGLEPRQKWIDCQLPLLNNIKYTDDNKQKR